MIFALIFGFTALQLAASIAAFGSTLIGLYIGYQAYRSLKRHDSPPMRYLAIGLIVLTTLTYTVAFVSSMLLRLELLPLFFYQDLFRAVVRVLQFVGLALIAYSLHIRRN